MTSNFLITLLMLSAMLVILGRCIELSAVLSRKLWSGHPFRFAAFSVAVALTAGGAVGVLFGWGGGPVLLLLGIGGWMFFDRRL